MQAETKQIAENVLNAKLGEGESLGGSSRSAVWRVPVLDSENDLPETVVVKRVQDAQFDGVDIGTNQRFIRDLAALQFLNSLFEDRPPVPQLYGSDNEKMLFVMEDIQGTGFHLDLLGDNRQQTETRLENIACALGRIHAASVDKINDYNQIHQALGHLNPFGFFWLEKGWTQLAELSDIPLPEDIKTAYTQVKELAENAGKWSVFTHSDLCPDNVLVTDDAAYIIDFEVASFQIAGFDACYPRLMMPTCWCGAQFPAALVQKFETVYRSEVANVRPEIEDDSVFEKLLVDGMVLALSVTLNGAVHGAKEAWELNDEGLASWRQRLVYRLNTFHEITKHSSSHIILGDYAVRVADALSKEWAITDIPFYAPFKS